MLTTIPKPDDPTQSFTATYDPRNRLVKIEEGANTIAECEYDGAKRRTVKKTYVSGQLDETRHFFYTAPSRWQVVEERIGTSTSADRHFVWGLRYVDDLILRDRDSNVDRDFDERLYGMHDANCNVSCLTNSVGAVQERYTYDAYGVSDALAADFGNRGNSTYAWETGFAGYRCDTKSLLLCVRNRFYQPRMGAWVQRDPLRLAAGENVHEYVRSNPAKRTDAAGTGAIDIACKPIDWLAGHPWLDDAFKCACGITSLLDIIPPFHPIFAIASKIDCACGAVQTLRDICACRARPPWLPQVGLLGTLLWAIDCVSEDPVMELGALIFQLFNQLTASGLWGLSGIVQIGACCRNCKSLGIGACIHPFCLPFAFIDCGGLA